MDKVKKCGATITNKVENFVFAKIPTENVAHIPSAVDESHKINPEKLISNNSPSEKSTNKNLNCDNLNLSRDVKSVLLFSDTQNANVIQKCSVSEESNVCNVLQREVEQENNIVQTDVDGANSEVTDNENAEWDSVKNLTNDQQRYEHVRKCWGTRKVPNPNKDLTFCSYMKKRLLSRNENSVLAKYRKQRKRVATHSPCERNSKRQKTNDYFNKKMDLVTTQSRREKHSVYTIFKQQMDTNRWNCFHQMSDFYNQPYFMNETWRREEIEMMWVHEQNSLHEDRAKHLAWINRKEAAEIEILENIKNEVLKFNQFYQGLGVGEDLTVLTDKQYQELKEIDEMYDAYEKFYYN